MKLPLLSALSYALILSPSLASPTILNPRANTIATGLLDVYNIAECASTGLAAQVKEYTLDNRTPPNPNLAVLPFLSFRAGVQGGETVLL